MKRTLALVATLLLAPLATASAADRPLSDFCSLARTEAWTEQWPDAAGKIEARAVTAEVWTDAMQACLEAQGRLHIPARDKPYYLDGPLVLKSGRRLTADPQAEIRLKPGCNTCLVRNANVVGFAERPVPDETAPDTDLYIEGGIWTTLATAPGQVNGNWRGASAKQDPVPGTHGVILLQNVRRVTVRKITVRQSQAFAVHFGNATEFTVEGLTLEGHRRDGVHVNGPASHGVIRRVQGDSGDDPVALNAWEWIVFNRPGTIELHANTDGLTLRDVTLNFPLDPDWHLLAIGPKSQTYKHAGSEEPANWTEIFSPDLDCTVRNLTVSGVRLGGSANDLPLERVVHVVQQKLNPEYPRTTPRGGTGKGIWVR